VRDRSSERAAPDDGNERHAVRVYPSSHVG
jgi:hypothetical protein